MKVAVYSKRGVWMSYTHPAKARKLLNQNKAVIFRYIPFAIKINKEGEIMFVSYENSVINLDKVERIEYRPKDFKIMFFMESVTARENWKFDDEKKALEIFGELKNLITSKQF